MSRNLRTFLLAAVVIMVLVFLFQQRPLSLGRAPVEKDYSTFVNDVMQDRVLKGTFQRDQFIGQYMNSDEQFYVTLPPSDQTRAELVKLLIEKKVRFEFEDGRTMELVQQWIGMFLAMLLVVGLFWILLARTAQAGSSQAFSFGKARARRYNESIPKVTFNDVAGVEEAKQELAEVVDYLKNTKKYQALGAKIPKGILLLGPPGCGKCISGDSLVLTNKGLMRIDEIPKYFLVDSDSRVYGANVATVEADNLQAVRPAASHWYNLGEEETLIINTRLGYSIEGTYEHPILILNEEGQLEFKPLSKLRVGDKVAIRHNDQMFGNCRELDTETAYVLGLLVGDGGMTIKNRVSFSNADEQLVEAIANYFRTRYDYHRKKTTGTYDYCVFSREIKQDLQRWGLTEGGAEDKRVPEWVKLSDRERVVAFLQGLFDADGGVEERRGCVTLSMASHTLAREVGTLLLNLGIVNRLYSRRKLVNHKQHFYLEVSGDFLAVFEREVGFRLERKQEALRRCVERHRNTNLNVVYHQHNHIRRVWSTLVESGAKPSLQVTEGFHKNILRYAAPERNPSRSALSQFVSPCATISPVVETLPEFATLRAIAMSDLYFTTVTSIEKGRNVVYDFTVPGEHSFVANGMINHNTLLARAVAGEASVPFFHISGSDFVEMFVGVGAARVRDLFENAKANRPALIFIDEIDAVGRLRGAGLGGGHDEREQTLNQLLVEMDGFDPNLGIIVLAATNRPDILDPALLRPGRFDRHIVVDPPDLNGRTHILQVHMRGKPLAPDVETEVLAKRTPGFTGADLANLVNEAALLAARREKSKIGMEEFEEAIDRVIAGPQRRSRVMDQKERVMVAYHEVGHAIVGELMEHGDPVHKVSILPRGMALGYTIQMPERDRRLTSKSWLLDEITTLQGGRVAEEIVFGDVSTGAHDDLKRATELARAMVCEYGMSEKLGPVTLGRRHGNPFLGRDLMEDRNYSEQVAYEIDQEVRTIIETAYQRAREILMQYRTKMDEIVQVLLEKENLSREEFLALLHGGQVPSSEEPPMPTPSPAASEPQVEEGKPAIKPRLNPGTAPG